VLLDLALAIASSQPRLRQFPVVREVPEMRETPLTTPGSSDTEETEVTDVIEVTQVTGKVILGDEQTNRLIDLPQPESLGETMQRAVSPGTGDTEETEVTEETDVTEETQVTAQVTPGDEFPPIRGECLRPKYSLAEALQLAQPTAEHQNNARLFTLARDVRALEIAEGREWNLYDLLWRVFNPWYEANQYLREDQSSDDYWCEFLRAHDSVKFPRHEDIRDRAWAASETQVFPRVALESFTDPELRQLVLWCQELQRLAGDKAFWLSCRDVQQRFGLSNATRAANRLHALVRLNILKEVEKGGPKTNKATRFRYVPTIPAILPVPPQDAEQCPL